MRHLVVLWLALFMIVMALLLPLTRCAGAP